MDPPRHSHQNSMAVTFTIDKRTDQGKSEPAAPGRGSSRAISTARLTCRHAHACGLSTSSSSTALKRDLISGPASRLDAFSAYPIRAWVPGGAPGGTTGSPEARPARSSRTSARSRATLMGEQPNPWDLLQPQDVTSRHRGAKPFRRYGLLGMISLLSPEYLLSFERWPFHAGPPDHYALVSYLIDLSVSQSSALPPLRSTAGYRSA